MCAAHHQHPANVWPDVKSKQASKIATGTVHASWATWGPKWLKKHGAVTWALIHRV